MPPVVRFAPSPTGFLHIGGARTALFNWLFARHHGGLFRLRIEDTDRQRSTREAVDAIIDGLRWLGLDWDGEIVMQSSRAARHAEVAADMLAAGSAYRCYCSPEELAADRERQRAEGRPIRYEGTWRDRDPSEAPAGVAPVVRIRSAQIGTTVVDDKVQGEVRVANDQLDDMILLRADGTPTYMLSVVVDDHDMDITHIIRGDDHLTNTFRQLQIYRALGWNEPTFGHIPLIHGPDGAKLSKRHGALGIEAYRDMGYLPAALRNYLLRLGWSHGDDEVITTSEAIKWFDLDAVGRSPARLDFAKLDSLNSLYLRQANNADLVEWISPFLPLTSHVAEDEKRRRLTAGMAGLKERAKKLSDLADNARFYIANRPLSLDPKAAAIATLEARTLVESLASTLAGLPQWNEEEIQSAVHGFAAQRELTLKQIAQPLRAALTGSTISPGIFDVMHVLGKAESLGRMHDFAR